MKLVEHGRVGWISYTDRLTDCWAVVALKCFLTSTLLDWTPTVSRVAVTVGVDVEVTGVRLSHQQ